MHCTHCHHEIPVGSRFCPYCGSTTEPPPPPPPPVPDPHAEFQPQPGWSQEWPRAWPQPMPPVPPPLPEPQQQAQTSGAAIAALVFGVLGLTGFWLVGPILAYALARRADREIAASYGGLSGGQLARAGRILATTSLVLTLVIALVAGVLYALSQNLDLRIG